MRPIPRPAPGEYPPYARMYLDYLPEDDRVLLHLEEGLRQAEGLARGLTEEQLLHRYAPGKWSVKEVLLHVVDDERIYAYRALRFARGDATPLPGFDEKAYAPRSGADARSVGSILEEYRAVRAATLALFAHLPEEAFDRAGTAEGNRATVRALAWHIAGHERRHLAVIRERYLGLRPVS